jgi:hypothetical protein
LSRTSSRCVSFSFSSSIISLLLPVVPSPSCRLLRAVCVVPSRPWYPFRPVLSVLTSIFFSGRLPLLRRQSALPLRFLPAHPRSVHYHHRRRRDKRCGHHDGAFPVEPLRPHGDVFLDCWDWRREPLPGNARYRWVRSLFNPGSARLRAGRSSDACELDDGVLGAFSPFSCVVPLSAVYADSAPCSGSRYFPARRASRRLGPVRHVSEAFPFFFCLEAATPSSTQLPLQNLPARPGEGFTGTNSFFPARCSNSTPTSPTAPLTSPRTLLSTTLPPQSSTARSSISPQPTRRLSLRSATSLPPTPTGYSFSLLLSRSQRLSDPFLAHRPALSSPKRGATSPLFSPTGPPHTVPPLRRTTPLLKHSFGAFPRFLAPTLFRTS